MNAKLTLLGVLVQLASAAAHGENRLLLAVGDYGMPDAGRAPRW